MHGEPVLRPRPERGLDGRMMPPSRLRRTTLPHRPAGWLALGLGGLCLLVEAGLLGADAGLWGTASWRPRAYQNGAFWAGLLRDWRANYPAQPATMFLSYSVLHGGPWHLLGNLLALGGLMRALGRRIDAGRLAVLWLGAAVAGGAAFGLISDSPRPMVGASGAIFGLAGAWMVWEAAELRAAGLSRWPVWRGLLFVVLLHPLLWVLQAGMLAWETHLGGLVAGALLARALGPARSVTRRGA